MQCNLKKKDFFIKIIEAQKFIKDKIFYLKSFTFLNSIASFK